LKITKENIILNFIVYITAFLLAIGLGAVLIWAILRIHPFSALSLIVSSALLTSFGRTATFYYLVELTLISLGLAISYRAKYWNIGGDGQLIFGAIFSMQAIFSIGHLFSPWLAIVATLLMGMLGGALYGVIPAIIKAKLNVNEVLSTLMLNFIAIYFMTWLVDITGPWKDPQAAELESYPIPYSLYLENPVILTLIMVFAIAIIYILAEKTSLGFKIKVIGSSHSAAEYAGIDRGKVYIYIGLISGALAGLAGSIEILSVSHILSSSFDSLYMGYLGIFTTWLASLNPLFVILSSLLMSTLLSGGYFMEAIAGVSVLFIYYFEGIMFISIIIFEATKSKIKKVLKFG